MVGLVEHTVALLVRELRARGRLVLVAGASEERLVAELVACIAGAPRFAQLGPLLGEALVRSALVEELYADDREIVEIVNASGSA